MSIGNRIIKILEVKKLTQKEFAELTGINAATLTSIKQNKYDPSAQTIIKICEIFNINANWLLTGKGEMFITHDDNKEISLKAGLEILQELTSLSEGDLSDILDYIRNKGK